MSLSALGVTAITDFVLAGEALFLAGLLVARSKQRWSAVWYWQGVLLMLALGAFIGGVDHGFFQIAGETHVRKTVQHTTWVVLGVLTAATVMTVVAQFLDPRWRRIGAIAAAIQFALFVAAIPLVDSFAVVIVNYVPVMLWSLVCNIRGLRDRTGTWPMILSIVVALAASMAQALGVRFSDAIDRNGVYHLGMMIAVWLSYRGGLRLNGMEPAA